MKFLSNLRNRLRANLLKNQSGQGATEYILLLVVVVGLVLAFKKPIMEKMQAKVGDLGTAMDKVTVE
jgi:Flp pilus assembly pilin Flp